MLKYYTELWEEIKEQIKLIKDDKVKYAKNIVKIKFETDDKLPLDKIIHIPECVLIVSSVFKEDYKYHPQVLLHGCSYEYEKVSENYPQVLIEHCSCECE